MPISFRTKLGLSKSLNQIIIVMKKLSTSLGLTIVVVTLLIAYTQCSKGLNGKQIEPDRTTTTNVIPNLLPGKCPYPCTDTRCKAYANGYCGTGGGGGTDTFAVVKNSANPEDSAGARHNGGLAAIMPNYINGVEPTPSNAWSYTISYLNSYPPSFLGDVEDTMINRYDTAIFSMTVNSFSSFAYSHGQISSQVYTYLNSLGNLITALPDSPTLAAYSSFASSVINLESTILGDNSITSTDRILLLSSTSVARYSASYWANYYNSSSSSQPAARLAPQVAGPGKGWFSWSTVAGGDIVGAAGGALGGAAVGVMAGGIGAGPGAAAGAVGGAIGGSVYEAGMQIWHHFFG